MRGKVSMFSCGMKRKKTPGIKTLKHSFISLVILLGMNGILLANSQAETPEKNVVEVTREVSVIDSTRIENLIQTKLPNTPVGLFLQDAKTGKILYERRAKEIFLPASTAKLITAATSLFVLGSDFQYETAFKTAGKIHSGILNDNLYLTFSGDPSFTIENLQDLVKALKEQGIKQIKGNLIIDNTLFKGRLYPYGWMADDLVWYYAAPVSTVIVNENKIKLLVKANKTLGAKTTIALASEEKLPIKILSQDVLSVTETDAKESCELNVKIDSENNINIKGCWPAKESDDELKVAIQNPNLVIKQMLKQILKSENIVLNGRVILGETSEVPEKSSAKSDSTNKESKTKNLSTLALHRSLPLTSLIQKVLQDSNNMYAESIVKMMGVKQLSEGSFQTGLRAMNDILSKKFGIDTTKMRLRDGSGESRYNGVSPAQLGRVLYGIYHTPEFYKIFQETLPNSGSTGTLKKRMESFDLNEVVYAKTGTMTGVSSLAGYLNRQNQNKDDLIFVIMINGALSENAAIKQFENELCQLFVHY